MIKSIDIFTNFLPDFPVSYLQKVADVMAKKIASHTGLLSTSSYFLSLIPLHPTWKACQHVMPVRKLGMMTSLHNLLTFYKYT